MRKALLISCLLLSACTPFAVNFDAELLEKCETPPKLEGLDGASVLSWARQAGPEIVECARIHNALVKVIRAGQAYRP